MLRREFMQTVAGVGAGLVGGGTKAISEDDPDATKCPCSTVAWTLEEILWYGRRRINRQPRAEGSLHFTYSPIVSASGMTSTINGCVLYTSNMSCRETLKFVLCDDCEHFRLITHLLHERSPDANSAAQKRIS